MHRHVIVRNLTEQIGGTWQWELHVYGLSIGWFAVSLYVFVLALNLRATAPCKWLLWRICILLCLSGILRAVYLIFDPYESKQRMDEWLSRSLFSAAPGVLISSFVFVFLTLLHLTKVNVSPYILQNVKFLTLVVCSYVATVLLFEMLNYFYPVPFPYYAAVLTFLALWPIMVCLGFFRYGLLMLKSLSTGGGDPTAQRYCKIHTKKLLGGVKNGYSGGGANRAVRYDKAPPKIRITDENDCSYSYRSDNPSPAVSDVAGDQSSGPEDYGGSGGEENNSGSGAEGGKILENGSPDSVDSRSSISGPSRTKKGKASSKSSTMKPKTTGMTSLSPVVMTSPKSRTARLRSTVKLTFIPATLSLFTVGCLYYESYYSRFLVLLSKKWEWFIVATVSRVAELLLAIAVAFVLRRGFNRL